MLKQTLNKGISTPIAIGIVLILVILVSGFTWWQYGEIKKEEFNMSEVRIPGKEETRETIEKIGYFIFQIETNFPNQEFRFQVDDADLYINWGDGKDDAFKGTDILEHNYSEAGIYNISLQGNASRIAFGLEDPEEIRLTPTLLIDILTPVSNGVSGIISAKNMFKDTTNFGKSILATINFFDETSKNVTDMSRMFFHSQFNQPINKWDVSNVTDMESMFAHSQFNQDISDWDVSGAKEMHGMFAHSQFNQDISDWDVSGVTNMSMMFFYSKFNQPIGAWDVSSVESMYHMFTRSEFNQPIDDWDVSNVAWMFAMFTGSQFNQPINKWDVSNVTDTHEMFAHSQFNQDISDWDVSGVTNVSSMFTNSALSRDNYDALLNNWNNLSLQKNLNFGVDELEYCKGANSRQSIIDKYNWNFSGDILNCD